MPLRHHLDAAFMVFYIHRLFDIRAAVILQLQINQKGQN